MSPCGIQKVDQPVLEPGQTVSGHVRFAGCQFDVIEEFLTPLSLQQ
jgi:hypothetical protein